MCSRPLLILSSLIRSDSSPAWLHITNFISPSIADILFPEGHLEAASCRLYWCCFFLCHGCSNKPPSASELESGERLSALGEETLSDQLCSICLCQLNWRSTRIKLALHSFSEYKEFNLLLIIFQFSSFEQRTIYIYLIIKFIFMIII